MVYITKSNAKRILEKLDFGNKTFTGVLYEKPIYIFNSYEQKQLLAYKGFMQSPKDFITCIYKKESLKIHFVISMKVMHLLTMNVKIVSGFLRTCKISMSLMKLWTKGQEK